MNTVHVRCVLCIALALPFGCSRKDAATSQSPAAESQPHSDSPPSRDAPPADAKSADAKSDDATQPSRDESSAKSPPPAAALPGFTQSTDDKPTKAPESGAVLSADEQARFDAAAVAWLRALNADDKAAYRALHSDDGWTKSIDWWQNMFTAQRAKFGAITRAYPCTRAVIRFGGFGFQCKDVPGGVSFVAIFEENVGGVFTFSLDATGKISGSSVFIKEEIASYDGGAAKPIYSR
ncbi:MAG: hypothetical protein ACKVS9_11250 [Phycisphaerae bacterium]